LDLIKKKDAATFDKLLQAVHPDDICSVEEIIDKATKEHRPILIQYRIIMPSKELRWLNFFGDTQYDDKGYAIKVTGICIDITDLKKSIEIAESSEKKYLNLFERILEGLAYCKIEYDNAGNPVDFIFLNVNDSFKNLTSIKQAVGKRATELFPGLMQSNPEIFKICGRVAKTGKPEIFDDFIIPLSMWLHISIFSSSKNHFMALFENINEQVEAKKTIIKANKKLKKTLQQTINSLASIVEIKDPYTSGHQIRVQKLSVAIAKEIDLTSEVIEAISTAAIIHDIGKIMIPASILAKPSKLSDLEYSIIRTHPKAGYDIIKNIDFTYNIKDIILQHHEKLDGSGYPSSLKGDEIKLEARIIAVSDVVEAMSSHRPYRPAIGIDEALKEIKSGSGILYDRNVVKACLKLFKEDGFTF